MKNPLKQIKHMVKDPINTIDEANARKKEIMPWLYGSIAVAVLPGLLGSLISALDFRTMFSIIGVAGIMLFGFLLFVIKKAKQKFQALTCDKCNVMAEIKTPEDFTKYVNYTVGEHVAEYRGISHPASNDGVISEVEAKGSATVAVSIDLKCPHCGEVKRLIYTITPFKCSAVEKKVAVSQVEVVKMRLENNVKEVVKDYNDLIIGTENTKSSGITSAMKTLQGITDAYSKELAALGITIDKEDATLKFDEDSFLSADMKTAKSLFIGTGSLAYQITAKATMVANQAETEANKSNTYTDTATYSNNYNTGTIFYDII